MSSKIPNLGGDHPAPNIVVHRPEITKVIEQPMRSTTQSTTASTSNSNKSLSDGTDRARRRPRASSVRDSYCPVGRQTGILMKRICNSKGCNALTEGRYCHLHQPGITAADNRRRSARRTRDGRDSAAWRRVRLAVLMRDGHRCMLRLDDACQGVASSVHRLHGGDHRSGDLTAYLSACARCHGKADGAHSQGRRSGVVA